MRLLHNNVIYGRTYLSQILYQVILLKGHIKKKILVQYKHMYKCTCMCIYSQRHMHRIDRVTLKAEMLYKN